MNVSVVIPNYNGEELLKKNLPKVMRTISDYKDGDMEVIIVDDGSTDGSLREIQNSNFKLKIIINKKNLGFSSTVNRGIKEASGEIIVLLNTDVVPEIGFLKPLLAHFKNPSVFAVGCMDKSIENKKVIFRGRGLGKWAKGFLIHSRGEVDKTDTLWVSGGSGAFRKSIWDKLGGFNELYNPFYWEDIDLSYRALKSGYKIFFEPKSMVVHEHQRGAIKKKYPSSYIRTVAYRNQFIFVWENVTDLDLQFLHIFWLPYHFLKALLRGDWTFFLGFFQAFIRLPKVVQTSFKVQKLFIKSDKEVIEKILE